MENTDSIRGITPKHNAIMRDRVKISIVYHQKSFQVHIWLNNSNCIKNSIKFWDKLINMFLPGQSIL
jgi:hypothetical protein